MDVHDWNIGLIATKRAILTPKKAALIYEDRPITYKELNEHVNRIAHYLQDKGIKKGDRISVLLRNCPEFLEIYFASAKLGLIFVPLNFRMVGPELEYQLNNAESRLLIFHDSFSESIHQIQSTIKVEKDKFVYVKSGDPEAPGCPEWATDYDDLMKNYASDEPKPDGPIGRDDPFAIMYTAGSTGAPKGAVFSHLQTYFKCFQVMLYFDMRADDMFLSHMPLCHSGGLFMNATPTLCRGATLVLRQRFEPEEFARDIEKYRATIVVGITTMWKFILQSKKLNEVDTSSIRVVLGGGERTPQSIFDELMTKGISMQLGMGQTENSFMLFLPKEDVERKMGSIGLPGFFADVWIADEQCRELPPGEIGEIVARGPTVMSGYWNMPEETARTIMDGVHHTGDLGYRDKEGYFYIVDRLRDMYRSGGENVYPAEIEKVLANHPKIFNVAIIGVPDEKWGETGVAFIIPRQGENLNKEEVLEFLQGKVARYKFPTQVEFVNEIPMTVQGKIKKGELKGKYHVIKERREKEGAS